MVDEGDNAVAAVEGSVVTAAHQYSLAEAQMEGALHSPVHQAEQGAVLGEHRSRLAVAEGIRPSGVAYQAAQSSPGQRNQNKTDTNLSKDGVTMTPCHQKNMEFNQRYSRTLGCTHANIHYTHTRCIAAGSMG